jgi:hypothetical protein
MTGVTLKNIQQGCNGFKEKNTAVQYLNYLRYLNGVILPGVNRLDYPLRGAWPNYILNYSVRTADVHDFIT